MWLKVAAAESVEYNVASLDTFLLNKAAHDTRLENVDDSATRLLPEGNWTVVVIRIPSINKYFLAAADNKRVAEECCRSLFAAKIGWLLTIKFELIDKTHEQARSWTYRWIDSYVRENEKQLVVDLDALQRERQSRLVTELYSSFQEADSLVVRGLALTEGLVAEVDEMLQRIPKQQIKKLMIEDCQFQACGGIKRIFSAVGRFSQLLELRIEAVDLRDQELREFKNLWYLTPSLKVFQLRNCDSLRGDYYATDFIKSLAGVLSLELLDLSRNMITYEAMSSLLCELLASDLLRIRKLDLSYNDASLDELRILSDLHLSSKRPQLLLKLDPFNPSLNQSRPALEDSPQVSLVYEGVHKIMMDPDYLKLDSMEQSSLAAGSLHQSDPQHELEVHVEPLQRFEVPLLQKASRPVSRSSEPAEPARQLTDEQLGQYCAIQGYLGYIEGVSFKELFDAATVVSLSVYEDGFMPAEEIEFFERWLSLKMAEMCGSEDLPGIMMMMEMLKSLGMTRLLDKNLDTKRRMMKRVAMMVTFEKEIDDLFNLRIDAKQINDKLDELVMHAILYNIAGPAVDLLKLLREHRNELLWSMHEEGISPYDIHLEILERRPFVFMEYNKEHQERSLAPAQDGYHELGLHETLLDYELLSNMTRQQLVAVFEDRRADLFNKFQLFRFRRISYVLSEPNVKLFKLYKIDSLLTLTRTVCRFRWKESGARTAIFGRIKTDCSGYLGSLVKLSPKESFIKCPDKQDLHNSLLLYASSLHLEDRLDEVMQHLSDRVVESKKLVQREDFENKIKCFFDLAMLASADSPEQKSAIERRLLERAAASSEDCLHLIQEIVLLVEKQPTRMKDLDTFHRVAVLCCRYSEAAVSFLTSKCEATASQPLKSLLRLFISYVHYSKLLSSEQTQACFDLDYLQTVHHEERFKAVVEVLVDDFYEELQVDLAPDSTVHDIEQACQARLKLGYPACPAARCGLFLVYRDERWDQPLPFEMSQAGVKRLLLFERVTGAQVRLVYQYRVWLFISNRRDVFERMKRMVLNKKVYRKNGITRDEMMVIAALLAESPGVDSALLEEFRQYKDSARVTIIKEVYYMINKMVSKTETDPDALFDIMKRHVYANGSCYDYQMRGMMTDKSLQRGTAVVCLLGLMMYRSHNLAKVRKCIGYQDMLTINYEEGSLMIEFVNKDSAIDTLHFYCSQALLIVEDMVSYMLINMRMARKSFYALDFIMDKLTTFTDVYALIFRVLPAQDEDLDRCVQALQDAAVQHIGSFAHQLDYHAQMVDQHQDSCSTKTFAHIRDDQASLYSDSEEDLQQPKQPSTPKYESLDHEDEARDEVPSAPRESARRHSKTERGSGTHRNSKRQSQGGQLFPSSSLADNNPMVLIDSSQLELALEDRNKEHIQAKIDRAKQQAGLADQPNAQVVKASITSALRSFPKKK